MPMRWVAMTACADCCAPPSSLPHRRLITISFPHNMSPTAGHPAGGDAAGQALPARLELVHARRRGLPRRRPDAQPHGHVGPRQRHARHHLDHGRLGAARQGARRCRRRSRTRGHGLRSVLASRFVAPGSFSCRFRFNSRCRFAPFCLFRLTTASLALFSASWARRRLARSSTPARSDRRRSRPRSRASSPWSECGDDGLRAAARRRSETRPLAPGAVAAVACVQALPGVCVIRVTVGVDAVSVPSFVCQ